jgi:hypothetical protein
MAKLNIEITATVAHFSDYADQLGYMTEVSGGMDEDDNPIILPNPETKQAFLGRRIKDIVAEALALPAVNNIERVKRTEAREESNTTREQIKGAIRVNFSA